jgi:hypothetical protein
MDRFGLLNFVGPGIPVLLSILKWHKPIVLGLFLKLLLVKFGLFNYSGPGYPALIPAHSPSYKKLNKSFIRGKGK